jgi:hypothetical protein
MTKAEREQAAVDRHTCPRCHKRKLNRCRSTGAVWKVMKHPHPERVKLVKEG